MGEDHIFDVIIAGAGPAGCVLANRLSMDPARRVLLIDAGPDAPPGTEHPDVLNPYPAGNAAFYWPGLLAQTGAEPCNGAARVAIPYVQGYGVGGGSNINGMGIDRGQPDDYDEWSDLHAPSWSWREVLPYFRKVEHDLDFPSCSDERGPLPIRRLPRERWAPFAAALGNALHRRGFDAIADLNSDFRDGFGATPTNSLPDRRVSASMAYLTTEVRRRANLEILAHTMVERVSFEGRRANGVVIRTGGVTRLVGGREVIVACGAIQSPALLMRSGIGPGERLVGLGIPVVHALRGVGANLQNHPCVTFATYLAPEAMQAADNPWLLQNWLRFSSNHPRCASHDMHLMPFNKCAWHVLGRRVGAIVVTVMRSYSKGCVELLNADSTSTPSVRFNLLSDARDHDRLVSGCRLALELLIDPMVAQLHHEIFVPDEGVVASLSRRNFWNRARAGGLAWILDRAPLRRRLLAESTLDAAALLAGDHGLRELVRKHAQPQYHVCGTCRMGREDDLDAVVDSAGRVHAVGALRVVDASIFPSVPRAYPHLLVLMAAEKIADLINADWRRGASNTTGADVGLQVAQA